MQPSLDAFFIVDKPRGPTSHDVVARLRRASGVRRIGHAGTLDPLATGVLVVAIGRATRLLEYVAGDDKAYVADVAFGVETDSYDAEGHVVARTDASGLTAPRIVDTLGAFRGHLEQRPPAHSAISVGGKRLYELARAGRPVEAPLRSVFVRTIELRAWDPPVATLFVECSKGTYVRSLAHDLGRAVGTGAHLSGLRRTRSGAFTIERAIPLDALEARLREGTWRTVAIPLDDAVGHLPALELSTESTKQLVNGVPVLRTDDRVLPVGTLLRAVDVHGRLVAVVELVERDGAPHYRPVKVLSTDASDASAGTHDPYAAEE
ncbi:MAG TPA: tRNA pseudouridine(55) synthase TruB [Chloroflexota bacterium]|nr:tRNA pseudouridine(55) synthase TruB [Chloroflexota bacterium]